MLCVISREVLQLRISALTAVNGVALAEGVRIIGMGVFVRILVMVQVGLGVLVALGVGVTAVLVVVGVPVKAVAVNGGGRIMGVGLRMTGVEEGKGDGER